MLTSGPATNNAILMQIGGWLFIEFSETGNACYAFPIAGSLVELGRARYSLQQLKPPTGHRLLHKDGHLSWEQKFIQEVAQLGIAPDNGRGSASSSPRATRTGAPSLPSSRTASVNAPDPTNWAGAHTGTAADTIRETLQQLGVRFVDNRSRGGALWVYSDGRPAIDAKLKALGLKYKAEKGGFYLP